MSTKQDAFWLGAIAWTALCAFPLTYPAAVVIGFALGDWRHTRLRLLW